jgi:hypothetical protein
MTLVRLLVQSCSRDLLQGALLPAAAAMQLADLLLIGGGDRRQGACSCGMHSSGGSGNSFVAAITSGASPQHADERTAAAVHLGAVLDELAFLHQIASKSPAGWLLLARTGLQLHLRHLALRLAAARQLPGPQPAGSQGASSVAASGSGSSGGGGGVPSCADPSQFVAGWDGAAIMSGSAREADMALSVVVLVLSALSTLLEQPGAAACPRCMPQQLLLVLEGATRCCSLEEPGAGLQAEALLQLGRLLRTFSEAWMPAAFMVPAVPTLTAWLLAAAQQLRAGPPDGPAAVVAGGASSSSGGPAAELAASMERALAMVLVLPGGVLKAPDQHSGVQLEQLLACCELVMRAPCHGQCVAGGHTLLGVQVIQVMTKAAASRRRVLGQPLIDRAA